LVGIQLKYSNRPNRRKSVCCSNSFLVVKTAVTVYFLLIF